MSASFMETLGEANRAYNALLASFRSAYNSNGTINISTAGYVDVAQGSTVFAQGAMVLWLKYHDGYSLREIAKMMGITLAWAQKLDQRAKKRLAEPYREGGGSL
jgi:2-methylcitrate dehydratase PrpD